MITRLELTPKEISVGYVTFMGPIEARSYLQVSGNTLDRWRHEGWLEPACRVGAAFVYRLQALDECLKLKNQNQLRLEKEVADG